MKDLGPRTRSVNFGSTRSQRNSYLTLIIIEETDIVSRIESPKRPKKRLHWLY